MPSITDKDNLPGWDVASIHTSIVIEATGDEFSSYDYSQYDNTVNSANKK